MKKMYITPEVEKIKINSVSILASSPGFLNEGEVGDGEELSREQHGNTPSRPNLWDQGW